MHRYEQEAEARIEELQNRLKAEAANNKGNFNKLTDLQIEITKKDMQIENYYSRIEDLEATSQKQKS